MGTCIEVGGKGDYCEATEDSALHAANLFGRSSALAVDGAPVTSASQALSQLCAAGKTKGRGEHHAHDVHGHIFGGGSVFAARPASSS